MDPVCTKESYSEGCEGEVTMYWSRGIKAVPYCAKHLKESQDVANYVREMYGI